MSGYDEDALPSRYGRRDYLKRAVKMLTGPTGSAIRALQAKGLLEHVPTEILVGFIAPGFASSNTTEGRGPMAASVPFHEIGWWQVPAGPRDGTAPHPDPGARSNTWGRLATDPAVVAVLGRPATMIPNAWRTAESDQHAIGLVMLARDYASCRARLAPAIQPSAEHTPWGVACMFTAFSAGASGAADVIGRYAPALARVDEKRRFGALLRLVALDLQAGWTPPGKPGRHSNPAHRVLRTAQKFGLAAAIASAATGKSGFFDLFLGAEQANVERAVLRGSLCLPFDTACPIVAT